MQQRHPLAHWPAQRTHAPPCHARIHFRSAPQKFIALVSIVVWSVYSVCPGSKRGGLLPTQPAHDAWMRGTGCGVCALNPQPTSCPFQWALLHSQSAAVCSIAPPSLVGKRKKSSLTGAPILEHSLPPPSSFLMPHIPAQKKNVCVQPAKLLQASPGLAIVPQPTVNGHKPLAVSLSVSRSRLLPVQPHTSRPTQQAPKRAGC